MLNLLVEVQTRTPEENHFLGDADYRKPTEKRTTATSFSDPISRLWSRAPSGTDKLEDRALLSGSGYSGSYGSGSGPVYVSGGGEGKSGGSVANLTFLPKNLQLYAMVLKCVI